MNCCPKCGAEHWCNKDGYRWWKCGSHMLFSAGATIQETEACLKRQLAEARALIEKQADQSTRQVIDLAKACSRSIMLRQLLTRMIEACQAVLHAIDNTDLQGTILWIRPPYQAEGVHETAYERLFAVLEETATGLADVRSDNQRPAGDDLRDAAVFALDHIRELREAWRTGALSERDGLGGIRSNRNVEAEVKLRNALAAMIEGDA